MGKSSNLLMMSTEKVLANDIQILFGRSMKGAQIIEELLPVPSIKVEPQVMKPKDTLGTLDSWLEGMKNGQV